MLSRRATGAAPDTDKLTAWRSPLWVAPAPTHEHLGKFLPAAPRTLPLWKQRPDIWRQHTRRTPLGRVCDDPISWRGAVAQFEAATGRPLSEEELITHAGAAYRFVIRSRHWSLPTNVEEPYDIKRAATGDAYNQIWSHHVLRDDEDFAKRTFLTFGDFVGWFRTWAQHRVKRTLRAQHAAAEPRLARIRRRRQGRIECPWCWSASAEHVVPRDTRVCPRCHVALPRGVRAAFTETACIRYANDEQIGPGACSSTELPDRRSWPRNLGPVT